MGSDGTISYCIVYRDINDLSYRIHIRIFHPQMNIIFCPPMLVSYHRHCWQRTRLNWLHWLPGVVGTQSGAISVTLQGRLGLWADYSTSQLLNSCLLLCTQVGMWWSSNPTWNVVAFPQFFCQDPKSDRFPDSFTSDSNSTCFGKPSLIIHHSLPLAMQK